MYSFLSTFVSVIVDIYSFAIIARILMSWFPGANYKLRSFLNDLTDPYLSIFKNVIPTIGMIDISPIIALLALDLGKTILLSLISYLFLGL